MAKDPNEIGALWIRTGPKGQYMTGSITVNGEAIKIVCFPNNFKKEERHPDWRVLISQPKGEKEEKQGFERHNPIEYSKDDINPEDLPF